MPSTFLLLPPLPSLYALQHVPPHNMLGIFSISLKTFSAGMLLFYLFSLPFSQNMCWRDLEEEEGGIDRTIAPAHLCALPPLPILHTLPMHTLPMAGICCFRRESLLASSSNMHCGRDLPHFRQRPTHLPENVCLPLHFLYSSFIYLYLGGGCLHTHYPWPFSCSHSWLPAHFLCHFVHFMCVAQPIPPSSLHFCVPCLPPPHYHHHPSLLFSPLCLPPFSNIESTQNNMHAHCCLAWEG